MGGLGEINMLARAARDLCDEIDAAAAMNLCSVDLLLRARRCIEALLERGTADEALDSMREMTGRIHALTAEIATAQGAGVKTSRVKKRG